MADLNVHLAGLDLAVIALYALGIIALGLYVSKRRASAEGRQALVDSLRDAIPA